MSHPTESLQPSASTDFVDLLPTDLSTDSVDNRYKHDRAKVSGDMLSLHFNFAR